MGQVLRLDTMSISHARSVGATLAKHLGDAQRISCGLRDGFLPVSPAVFRVHVFPTDYDMIPDPASLSKHLARYLGWLAVQRGYVNPGSLDVELLRSSHAAPGLPIVEAILPEAEWLERLPIPLPVQEDLSPEAADQVSHNPVLVVPQQGVSSGYGSHETPNALAHPQKGNRPVIC